MGAQNATIWNECWGLAPARDFLWLQSIWWDDPPPRMSQVAFIFHFWGNILTSIFHRQVRGISSSDSKISSIRERPLYSVKPPCSRPQSNPGKTDETHRFRSNHQADAVAPHLHGYTAPRSFITYSKQSFSSKSVQKGTYFWDPLKNPPPRVFAKLWDFSKRLRIGYAPFNQTSWATTVYLIQYFPVPWGFNTDWKYEVHTCPYLFLPHAYRSLYPRAAKKPKLTVHIIYLNRS